MSISARTLIACTALLLSVVAAPLTAQSSTWPFSIGETLEYQAHVARMGVVGTGRMWVEGPVVEQGVSVWRLRFEMEAGWGPFRARDRTSSWLDPLTFGILRFEKEERHVLSRSRERVTIDRATNRWSEAAGPEEKLGHSAPLDELSFIYFLRTVRPSADSVVRFDRHFDSARNPTIVRFLGHDTLTTPAGTFATRIVEMEVLDPKRYKGTGVIRMHLADGKCRIPVRIESSMPVLGVTTLTLTGWSNGGDSARSFTC